MKKLIVSSLMFAGAAATSFGQADVIDLFYGAPSAPGSFLLSDVDQSTLLTDGSATAAFGFINTSDLGPIGTSADLAGFNPIVSSDDFITDGLFGDIVTIATTEADGETNLPFVLNNDITFLFVVYTGASLADAEGLFVATDSSWPVFPEGVDVPVTDAPDANFQVAEFDNVLFGTTTPGAGFISGGVGYSLNPNVPEPSTYAAIFGVVALGLGIARRRLRK